MIGSFGTNALVPTSVRGERNGLNEGNPSWAWPSPQALGAVTGAKLDILCKSARNLAVAKCVESRSNGAHNGFV
jgi:hypothetical protein